MSDSADTIHLTYSRSFSTTEACNQLVISYQGPYNALVAQLKTIQFFVPYEGPGKEDFPEGNSTTSGSPWSYPFASRAHIRRQQGDSATLELVVTQVRNAGVWGLDFTEISRPIMSWTPRDGEPINYQHLRAWQRLGQDNPASPDYNAFVANGEPLEGATLTLAKLIFRGIDSFVVYRPVITWQARLFSPPDISLYPLGMQMDSPSAPHGLAELGEKDFLGNIQGLADPTTGKSFVWVRSASRVATNSDGTYTWTMQFLAADEADADLYPSESWGSAS